MIACHRKLNACFLPSLAQQKQGVSLIFLATAGNGKERFRRTRRLFYPIIDANESAFDLLKDKRKLRECVALSFVGSLVFAILSSSSALPEGHQKVIKWLVKNSHATA